MGGGIFVYANPFRIAVMVVMPVTNSPMSLFCLYRLSNFLSWDNSDSDVNIPSYLGRLLKENINYFLMKII